MGDSSLDSYTKIASKPVATAEQMIAYTVGFNTVPRCCLVGWPNKIYESMPEARNCSALSIRFFSVIWKFQMPNIGCINAKEMPGEGRGWARNEMVLAQDCLPYMNESG